MAYQEKGHVIKEAEIIAKLIKKEAILVQLQRQFPHSEMITNGLKMTRQVMFQYGFSEDVRHYLRMSNISTEHITSLMTNKLLNLPIEIQRTLYEVRLLLYGKEQFGKVVNMTQFRVQKELEQEYVN